MIFLECIGSRARLSAEDEEGKKLPSSLEQLFSLFIFCKARRRRAGMCDHREQIPRRESHPVTSARGCATTGSKSPERASSRHIRTWMCDHREQTPSEGVTEIPVSPTLSEGVTRSLAVPVWNRCCCGNSYSSVLGRGCQAMNLPATVNGKYCSTSDL